MSEATSRASNPTAHLEQVTPIAPRLDRRRRSWDDVSLQVKMSSLTAAAAVLGTLLGMVEAHTQHRVWPLSLGLILLVGGLWQLGKAWIVLPIRGLALRIEEIRQSRSPAALRSLPVERMDEVGRIARVVQQHGALAIRDHLAARRLRRSIDRTIESETRKATRHLKALAMRDGLTDLGNRRFLDEHLAPLVASCLKSRTELICFVIDLDNFKGVNDTLGHATGDSLLIFLANLIRASIRREDLAVRLGGDEFVILLPHCDDARARHLARQLIALYRQHARASLDHPGMTTDLSIGVASLLADGLPDGRALLEKADANLYAAKRAGKGQAVGL